MVSDFDPKSQLPNQYPPPTRPSETRMNPGSGLLTVNSSTENGEADWPKVGQKLVLAATSRQQPNRGNRASRAAYQRPGLSITEAHRLGD